MPDMINLVSSPVTNKLFEIASPSAVINERIAIILGVITLVLAVSVFASCRTFLSILKFFGLKFSSENKVYRAFNKFHLWYWWLFGVSLVAHIMMAVFHTGLPQAGDPDAGTHWTILALGLSAGILTGVLFASCRFFPRLLTPKKPGSLLKNVTYNMFYRYHNYYWLLLLLVVAGHFTLSYLHAGIWPG